MIATVEKVVEPEACAAFRDSLKIPTHQVLAVCVEPFGAHPQPFYAASSYGRAGYVDDFEHYELWRSVSLETTRPGGLLEAALGEGAAYRTFVGQDRLEALASLAMEIREQAAQPRSWRPRARRSDPPASVRTAPLSPAPVSLSPPSSIPPPPSSRPRRNPETDRLDSAARANEILVVIAARKIVERVLAGGYPLILAGIGHAFLAARMAKQLLAERGVEVKVMVETGLSDLDCGPAGDEFLLSYRTIAHARRHSGVEDVLGTLTCGADSRCLGVIGAAQVDEAGDLNSTRIDQRFLVGSGGANDIASSAAELIVVSRAGPARLRHKVEYVTSPGRRVLTVATNLCAFVRGSADEAWSVDQLYPAYGGLPPAEALARIREACPWPYAAGPELEYAPIISTQEMTLVHTLDPRGIHWQRRD